MILKQENSLLHILLADDDKDDRFFFKKALMEIPIATRLTTVNDGEELMNYLAENTEHLPSVIFLDLSMPRKNGFECLAEINQDKKFTNISVVMFSTSYPRDKNYEKELVNMLTRIGAHHHIRKPGDFEELKKVIHNALGMVTEKIRLAG